MRSTLIEAGLAGLSGRFLKARKLRAFLTTLGVAFGVALIASLSILGATMQASIADQLRQGFGTYDIMAGYHGKLVQAEEQKQLRQVPGVKYAVGILWLAAGSRDMDGVKSDYNYIAIGEFPKGEFGYPMAEGRYPGPGEFVAEPRTVEYLDLKIGDSVTLNFRTGPQTVTLSGITKSAGKESSDSLLFNLVWLQEQMQLGQQVTLQVFGLQKGADKGTIGSEMSKLNPDLDIELRTELDEVVQNMAGLKPIAIAFGIAGLFASIFLVAGSFTIAVQERSRELALLRAVGASQQQVMRLVLREAVLLGTLGALLGILLGGAGALGALGAAATSLGVQQHALVLPWLPLTLIAAVGIALAFVAAWKPARSAGAVAPLAAMRPDAEQEARQEKVGGIGGLGLMALSGAAVLLAPTLEEGTGPRALFGAVGGLLFAAGLIMAQPRLLPWLVGALAWPLRLLFPAEAVLAGRSVLRHRKRSALTSATLVLGVMLVSSISTIFGEIAGNHMKYVQIQFPSDGMVTTRYDQHLGHSLAGHVAAADGVTAVATHAVTHWGHLQEMDWSRALPAWVAHREAERHRYQGHHLTGLEIIPLDPLSMSKVYDFGRIQGDLSGEGFTVTAQWALERGVQLGEMLTYRPDGDEFVTQESRQYPVVAIVQQSPFNSQSVLVSRSLFPGLPDKRVMFNYDAALKEEVKAAVQGIVRQQQLPMAMVRDLTDEMAEGEQATRQRWAIMGAVIGVIFMIGAFGLVNAIITGLHQRKREMATLRAVGSTPAQMVRQVILEAALLGMAGSLLGLLAGAAFTGGVMVGLSDPFTGGYPVMLYLGCLIAGPILAALAAILPGINVTRGSVSGALLAE